MRHLTIAAWAASFFLATGHLALANESPAPSLRDPEQARDMIERLYKIEQAFFVCDGLRMTGADLIKLDDAIAEIEESTVIPAGELQAMYEQVERAAQDASDVFCDEMSGAAGEIRAIRVSTR